MYVFKRAPTAAKLVTILALAVTFLGMSWQARAQTSQYILEAGDQIYIQVFDEPDLTMQATVAQSGSINYSYLGTIQVAGQTPEQLTQSITDKLRDGYLKNPSVNITVQKYRSFFVDGEVNRPGSYGYEPGLTLAKAVSLAGGMTDRASRRKIFLTREIDGEKKSYRVDMSQTVEPGDIITIREGFF
jgi:polysaccharide export outer membrane protein